MMQEFRLKNGTTFSLGDEITSVIVVTGKAWGVTTNMGGISSINIALPSGAFATVYPNDAATTVLSAESVEVIEGVVTHEYYNRYGYESSDWYEVDGQTINGIFDGYEGERVRITIERLDKNGGDV